MSGRGTTAIRPWSMHSCIHRPPKCECGSSLAASWAPDFRQQAQSEGDRIGANTTMTSHASTASKGSSGRSQKYPRIAVLGSTTRAWMVENLGIEPDAVAAKPGPKELKDAIEEVELHLRSRA